MKFTGGGEGYPKRVKSPGSDSPAGVRTKRCVISPKCPHFETSSIACAVCKSV